MGWSINDGIFTPYPPCFAFSWFRKIFEDNSFCRFAGSCGAEWGSRNRGRIMLTAAVVSFIALIFQLIPVISLDDNTQVLINTRWGFVRFEDVVVSICPEDIIVENDGDTDRFALDSSECQGLIDEDTCESCKDANQAAVSLAVISFITGFVQFMTDLQRSTEAGDLNCQKFMGIATGIAGGLSTLSSLSTYSADCQEKLPNSIDFNGVEEDLRWEYGPSFVLLAIASFLKAFDVLCHAIVPTPMSRQLADGDKLEQDKAEADP